MLNSQEFEIYSKDVVGHYITRKSYNHAAQFVLQDSDDLESDLIVLFSSAQRAIEGPKRSYRKVKSTGYKAKACLLLYRDEGIDLVMKRSYVT